MDMRAITDPRALAALADPRIAAMIRAILRAEGGFVDDKADAGGATNRGVSLRYALGIGLDNDRDGDTDRDDILLVTEEQAAALFALDFYAIPNLGLLPFEVRHFVFDYGVNSGPGRAIIGLQNTMDNLRHAAVMAGHNMPFWPDLIPDGRTGKLTAAAAAAAVVVFGADEVLEALCDERAAYLNWLAVNKAGQMRFRDGWINRVNSFRPSKGAKGHG